MYIRAYSSTPAQARRASPRPSEVHKPKKNQQLRLGSAESRASGRRGNGPANPARESRSAVRVPHGLRHRERRVGALQELHRGEHQLALADVLEIVHLELALAVGLVPGLTRLVRMLHGRAVLEMLPTASRRGGRPEIIQHVAVEADALARLEADHPHAH